MKRLLLQLIILMPLSAAVIYFGYTVVKYTRMISNIFMGLVYKPSPEFIEKARGEKVIILDSADREIETLLVERKKSDALVIFCHESGQTKESWEKYAYFLPEHGFSVLSVNLSRPEDDEADKNFLSQWPTTQDVERLLTVIRWSKKALRPGLKIALFGVSNGADIAFAASFEEPAVKAMIADGLFSMKEIFRDYIRKWAPILVKPNFFGEKSPEWIIRLFTALGFWYSQKKARKKFIDIEKFLRRKHAPLLMIHGENDDYIPPLHQKLLEKISRKKSPVLRLVVSRARHNESVVLARQLYEKQVIEFLEKYL